MPTESTAPVKFHLSLNVSNLEKFVEFFTALLGEKPAKQRVDYAKFELENPPLVLSLEPHAPGGRGLGHSIHSGGAHLRDGRWADCLDLEPVVSRRRLHR